MTIGSRAATDETFSAVEMATTSSMAAMAAIDLWEPAASTHCSADPAQIAAFPTLK